MVSITTSTGFAWFTAMVGVISLCAAVLVGREKRLPALVIGCLAILVALYLFFSNSVTLF